MSSGNEEWRGTHQASKLLCSMSHVVDDGLGGVLFVLHGVRSTPFYDWLQDFLLLGRVFDVANQLVPGHIDDGSILQVMH